MGKALLPVSGPGTTSAHIAPYSQVGVPREINPLGQFRSSVMLLFRETLSATDYFPLKTVVFAVERFLRG